jgi:hypothetical protein
MFAKHPTAFSDFLVNQVNVTVIAKSSFGGLGVSALASGTQVRGFKPGRNRRKNPQRAFLQKGSKTVGPMLLIYGM